MPESPATTSINIMYSSGTTGMPKGIMYTHEGRAAFCTHFAASFRIMPESVVLHAGSIVFNGALVDLMPWMFVGATYILHEAFDAERVIETIEREKVTHIIMVPAQIIAMLSSPAYDPARLESLEMLQNIGAPLLLEHKQRLIEELPGRFYELYGLTEGLWTILDKHDAPRKPGSVGCPPPFTEHQDHSRGRLGVRNQGGRRDLRPVSRQEAGLLQAPRSDGEGHRRRVDPLG